MHRKLTTVLLAILLALSALVPPAFAASAEETAAALGNTKDMLSQLGDKVGWSDDATWIVIGLARSGELTESQSAAYYNNVKARLVANGSAVLDENNASTNAKTILALTAAGCDVTDIGGYNLLAPIAHLGYDRKQGMNGPVWVLLAYDCNNYEIPECDTPKAQASREELVNLILSTQRSDHGWAFSGTSSDVDMTCMVLQALAPYYRGDNDLSAELSEEKRGQVREAVDEALAWLAQSQNADGSFSSGGAVCSESASQVLVALTSLGIDPAEDSRFIKDGKGALDALLAFYVKGGGFKHVDSNYKANNLASMQGYYALVAWYRYRDGRNCLYDMADAKEAYEIDVSYEEEEPEKPDQPGETPGKEPGKEPGKDSGSEPGKEDSKPPDEGGSGSQSAADDRHKDSSGASQADKPAASGTGKAAGSKTAKAGGVTKSGTKAGRIQLADKDKKNEKSKIEGVLEQIRKAAAVKLPAGAEKSGTNSAAALAELSKKDELKIVDAYKAFNTLSEAEQLAVTKDPIWKEYQKRTVVLGEIYHYDETSGTDVRMNEEQVLPWYIRLVIDPYKVSDDERSALAKALGEGGSVAAVYDVHFVNVLTGKPWIPEEILTVRMPLPEDLAGQPVVVHLADGRVAFMDAETVTAKGNAALGDAAAFLQFPAAEFSPYGIAFISDSLEDRLAASGADAEQTGGAAGAGSGWQLWALCGAAGLLALLALLVARRRASDERTEQ